MTNTCVCGCGRTLLDGYAHHDCTERARQQLAEIADLVEPARDVMYRQTTGDSTARGAPGPRDLLDYGAGAKLDAVQNALTGWARQICEERGVSVDPDDDRDVIVVAAEFLAANLEWMRHKDWVKPALTEIADCLHAMRSVVAAPAGRVYLGECGAPLLVEGVTGPVACDGDVYGRPGAATGGCRKCGAEYGQAERLKKNTALVQGGCYRASQLEHAYGLNAATVRKWAERGLIVAAEHDEQGRPKYPLADVRAVAASEGKRLEQARQKRHRREDAVAGVTPG